MKDLTDVNNELAMITEKIETFNTDERKEIKKNNKLIETYISQLEEIAKIFLNEIKEKYQKIIPNNQSDLGLTQEIDPAYKKIIYLSDNSYLFKMDIDKNLYEIKYGNSLDKINDNIIDIINKFKKVNIELNKDDFKYSLSLYKYMSVLFDNKDNENLNIKVKDTFDTLYWECPEIVNHIYLSFISLLEKNKEKFESYIKNQYPDAKEYDLELADYYKLVTAAEEQIIKNEYLQYEKFASNELKIEEYLDTSSNKKNTISKYIDFDKYLNLNFEEKKHFYEQIKSVYHDLCEYLWINKYSYLIDKIKEIYQNKNNYQNNYNNLIKNIKSLEKQKDKINNKLFTIYNRINNGKNNDRILKKYNNLFNKLNSKINEIITTYNEYEETLLINDILKKINEDSTYYDAFKIYENNYSYLMNLIKDKNTTYEEYKEFLYIPYLNISKSIPLLSEVNIEDKLSEKYDLFDIDANLSDKNKLKEDLEYIIRIGNFEQYNIDINKFKLIFDIKKIINE